jgi:hypothetical protein
MRGFCGNSQGTAGNRRPVKHETDPGRVRNRPVAPLNCFLGILSVLCLFCGLARADEFSRVSHHSVRMFSFGVLTIDTRMGDIRIEGWDEPRLEIEAEKVVQAKSAEKAKSLYDLLKIELQGKDKQVLLRTIYPPRRLWRPFRGESHLSVNFHIHMPYDANLKLKCVDGDVRVKGLTGQQQIRVNYGDVEVDVPSVYRLRLLNARSWLGYVESDLHGEENAGFGPRVFYRNPSGEQEIYVRVRMGGVFVYSQE